MSSTRTRSKGASTSARLGLTLRSVMLAPADGFEAAFAEASARSKEGIAPDEGYSPAILSAIGGASLMALWLKIGGLVGVREVGVADVDWLSLILALVLGALLGLAAMTLWGRIAPGLLRSMRGETSRREMRIVWGGAWLPQVVALVVLLPLDLLIAGRAAFAADRLEDSLAAAWAALSISVGIAAVLWSIYLLVKGTEVAADVPAPRTIVGLIAGALVIAVLVAGFAFGASALSETLS